MSCISTYFNVSVGGRIDHGHHAGRAVTALHDAVAMDKAVAKTKQIVDRGKKNNKGLFCTHTFSLPFLLSCEQTAVFSFFLKNTPACNF